MASKTTNYDATLIPLKRTSQDVASGASSSQYYYEEAVKVISFTNSTLGGATPSPVSVVFIKDKRQVTMAFPVLPFTSTLAGRIVSDPGAVPDRFRPVMDSAAGADEDQGYHAVVWASDNSGVPVASQLRIKRDGSFDITLGGGTDFPIGNNRVYAFTLSYITPSSFNTTYPTP